MKIIYIANSRIPTEKAHGIQIIKMCEAFSKVGYELELILPRRLNGIDEDIFKYYDVENNFKIKKFFSFDLIFFGQIGYLIQTVSFLLTVKLFLKRGKDDIIYSREKFAGFFFKNIIFEMHELPAEISCLHRWLFKRFKKFIVLTSYIKKALIKLGLEEENIFIAPDGVDLNKFNLKISKEEARLKLNLPIDKKIVAYTGSFYIYNWKGVNIIIEAAKYVGGGIVFMLVGGGREEIIDIQRKYGKMENVLLIERKKQSEIPYYLKASDILILPNKKGNKTSEMCTSPLKLFEYMASGRPIIASDLPSMREILNEKNSLLIKPNNPKVLADSVEFMLSNSKWKEMSKEAFNQVKKYTWNIRIKSIINFINTNGNNKKNYLQF